MQSKLNHLKGCTEECLSTWENAEEIRTGRPSKHEELVGWSLPPEAVIKINTHGASKEIQVKQAHYAYSDITMASVRSAPGPARLSLRNLLLLFGVVCCWPVRILDRTASGRGIPSATPLQRLGSFRNRASSSVLVLADANLRRNAGLIEDLPRPHLAVAQCSCSGCSFSPVRRCWR